MIRTASALSFFSVPLLLAIVSLAVVGDRPVFGAVLFGVGVLTGLVAEAAIRRRRLARRDLETHQLGYMVRSGLRDLILLSFAAVAEPSGPALFLVIGICVVLTGAHFLHLFGRAVSSRIRRRYVSWSNFEVPGVVHTERVANTLLRKAHQFITLGSALVALALSAVVAGASLNLLTTASLVALLMALVILIPDGVDLLRAKRQTGEEESIGSLATALSDYAPEVVLYYSRPERTGYIANVWMHTLEQLDRKIVVVVREAHNKNLIETEQLPIVRISRSGDIERLLPDSVKIALYPSNVAKNNHLIRLPGIVDVFVGHGDSDKSGSATTLSRIFDEVWVSGEAARDRYRVADVGVRHEQIREVGRPQLVEISRAALVTGEEEEAGVQDWCYTVLYAPTREGFYAEWEYSSIVTQGAQILSTLLEIPGVRVLFKPHPGTGTDHPEYRREVQRLKELVEAAKGPHELVQDGQGLYHAFNRADLLVSDVSSVITDFLASGKPYVVTNSGVETPEEFRSHYPSAGGAYILTGDGTELGTFIADAREHDSLHDQRQQTAHYLLGLITEDPIMRLDDAIGAAIRSHVFPSLSN